MKILKLALISVVALFLLMTAFSLLLPSKVVISRAIDIHMPLDTVYRLVNNVSYWPQWMDNYDSLQITVGEPHTGKGAAITSGKVKVIITEANDKRISAIWQSGDNRPLPGDFNFIEGHSKQVVTVQWQFIQHVKWYPWEKLLSIVSDKALGPYMEKSLDNLKNLAEGANN